MTQTENAQHTPAFVQGQYGETRDQVLTLYADNEAGDVVADIYSETIEEAEGIARFFIAAPDLLAAVALMYERCIVQGMSAEEDAQVRDTLKRARGED
jgi:hypothetical protein